jgi:chromosomal replication initiator protein
VQLAADHVWSVLMRIENDLARGDRIKSIQQAVAHMFGSAVQEFKTDRGPRTVALPRQIAMYLSREPTDASPSEIGRYFGGKHSSTVRSLITRVHDLRRTDAAFENALSKLIASLAAR